MAGNDELSEDLESDIFGADNDTTNQVAEALSGLIKKLGEDTDQDFFTDLSSNEINHISVLSLRDDETTKKFLRSYKDLQVSRRRKGRKELIEIAKAIGSVVEKEKETGLRSKLGL